MRTLKQFFLLIFQFSTPWCFILHFFSRQTFFVLRLYHDNEQIYPKLWNNLFIARRFWALCQPAIVFFFLLFSAILFQMVSITCDMDLIVGNTVDWSSLDCSLRTVLFSQALIITSKSEFIAHKSLHFKKESNPLTSSHPLRKFLVLPLLHFSATGFFVAPK